MNHQDYTGCWARQEAILPYNEDQAPETFPGITGGSWLILSFHRTEYVRPLPVSGT